MRSTTKDLQELVKLANTASDNRLRGLEREAMVQIAAKNAGTKKKG